MTAEEEIQRHKRTKKMLLYIGVFSIVMLFAGLTSAYIVSRASTFWVDIDMPPGFTVSTVLLLVSSFTVWQALQAAKRDRKQAIRLYLWLTLVLGIGFTVFQFRGWKQLTDTGNYVVANFGDLKGEHGVDYTFYYKGEPLQEVDGEFYTQQDTYHEEPLKDRILGSRNTASSYLYVLTVIHWLHLLGGLIYLMVVLREARLGRFHSGNTLRLELCGTYWHFLDGLWIYLFLFLLFIH